MGDQWAVPTASSKALYSDASTELMKVDLSAMSTVHSKVCPLVRLSAVHLDNLKDAPMVQLWVVLTAVPMADLKDIQSVVRSGHWKEATKVQL